jgi:hypothetical protein
VTPLQAALVNSEALAMLQRQKLATTGQLLTVMTRQQLDVQIRKGGLTRVWRGVYSVGQPDLMTKLQALDLLIGGHAVACMQTAATLYGFNVVDDGSVHVIDPGSRLRPSPGLVVHQRAGAPMQFVSSRRVTSSAWTAVELARQFGRPRGLAILDAAVRSGWCTDADLRNAIDQQRGRRGIIGVRGLLPLVDPRAESPMESEARLVMIDYGLPHPDLQYLIHGRYGECWRVDFAWPEARVAAEYESFEWHAGRNEMLRDKARFAGIQDAGWTLVPIVVDDVRRTPARMCQRIAGHLSRGL